jgi:hypothetical protein
MIRNHALLKMFMNDYPSRESGMSLIKPRLNLSWPYKLLEFPGQENLISEIPGFPVEEGNL